MDPHLQPVWLLKHQRCSSEKTHSATTDCGKQDGSPNRHMQTHSGEKSFKWEKNLFAVSNATTPATTPARLRPFKRQMTLRLPSFLSKLTTWIFMTAIAIKCGLNIKSLESSRKKLQFSRIFFINVFSLMWYLGVAFNRAIVGSLKFNCYAARILYNHWTLNYTISEKKEKLGKKKILVQSFF